MDSNYSDNVTHAKHIFVVENRGVWESKNTVSFYSDLHPGNRNSGWPTTSSEYWGCCIVLLHTPRMSAAVRAFAVATGEVGWGNRHSWPWNLEWDRTTQISNSNKPGDKQLPSPIKVVGGSGIVVFSFSRWALTTFPKTGLGFACRTNLEEGCPEWAKRP